MAKKIRTLFLFCIVTTLIITCKKNNIDTNAPLQQPGEGQVDLGAKVSASVSGFVTNETEAAVEGANVQYGESTTTTNKYGYFEIKDAMVNKNAAFVTVVITGYFKGIKTFIVEAGQPNFCRIKLIPKTIAGSVNSTSGGNITTSNGLSIDIPSNGIMDAGTKTMYTGTVHASMFWIDPTSDDLGRVMPGDLRGVDSANAINTLITYGMAIVELNGDAGEPLQVAEGKKVNISVPLPTTIAADAPATIPLWYFDETNGLWKEEGIAIKNGNSYTGEVAHFTYWNCDVPAPNKVNFNCIIEDGAGNPVADREVKITIDHSTYIGSAHGCTNANGYISGAIPANESLTLRIISSQTGCYIYTQQFSTGGTDMSLGTIRLSSNASITISGRAIDCNANPLTNGYVFFQSGYHNYAYPVTSGNFSFPLPVGGCNPNYFSVAAINSGTLEESPVQTYTHGNQSMNIPDITVCGQTMLRYANLTLDDKNYILGANPMGQTFCSASAYNSSPPYAASTNFEVSLLKLVNGVYIANGDKVYWRIYNTHWPPDLDSLNYLTDFNLLMGADNNYSTLNLYQRASDPCHLSFTEYGTSAGEYISGSISGRVYHRIDINNPPLDTLNPHNIICNFRVLKL